MIITPEELKKRHIEAIQPIKDRWLEPVHQSVDAEREVRRMLGEPGSWDEMIAVGRRLKKFADIVMEGEDIAEARFKAAIAPLLNACNEISDVLLRFHLILSEGDLDAIRQTLKEQKISFTTEAVSIVRRLRAWNLPIALDAADAIADLSVARNLFAEIDDFLGVGVAAVLADAGGGKTQLAAELTAPMEIRPAGIFLHGRVLRRGQTLDDLSTRFLINGKPVASMEMLLSSLDAAAKRAKCRLPLMIDGLNEAENPEIGKLPSPV